MKILLLVFTVSILFSEGARATEWKKVMGCANAESTLVVDLDSTGSGLMQVVIEGRDAVAYISRSMQGNSILFPSNLHLYDNGNKLVISELLASESFNPSTPDPYRIAVRNISGNRAALSWVSGSEIDPIDRYWFYNCRF